MAILTILTVVGVIFTLIWWDDIMNSCYEADLGFFEKYFRLPDDESVEECQKYLKIIIWSTVSFVAAIVIPVTFLMARVLYFGWKQVEYIEIGMAA